MALPSIIHGIAPFFFAPTHDQIWEPTLKWLENASTDIYKSEVSHTSFSASMLEAV